MAKYWVTYVDISKFYGTIEQIKRGSKKAYVIYRGGGTGKKIIALTEKAVELGVDRLMPVQNVPLGAVWIYARSKPEYDEFSNEIFRQIVLNFSQNTLEMQHVHTDGFRYITRKPNKGLAEEIKSYIDSFGFESTIGISLNKRLAQMAVHISKNSGKTEVIDMERWRKLYRNLEVDKVIGIGEKFKRKFNRAGFQTIDDIVNTSIVNWPVKRPIIYVALQGMQSDAYGKYF